MSETTFTHTEHKKASVAVTRRLGYTARLKLEEPGVGLTDLHLRFAVLRWCLELLPTVTITLADYYKSPNTVYYQPNPW